MNIRNAFITVGLAIASIVMLPAAHADDFDQASKLTFNQPVQIPGRRVLPAGTYWFVLANIGSRNVVQVFNSDKSTLYATILTISAERQKITEKTAMTFAERGTMQPDVIVTWFYPGRNLGHQFVYSKPEERELARAKLQTVTVG
jgi:hypothetical protein